MTTVYVVECCAYENQYVSGVYSTPEKAIAAHPLSRVLPDDFKWSASYAGRPGGWQEDPDHPGEWSNGLDWDDVAHITPFEVDVEHSY
jgi:hypothetical protein